MKFDFQFLQEEAEKSIFFLMKTERAITHRWIALIELIPIGFICFLLLPTVFVSQALQIHARQKNTKFCLNLRVQLQN